MGRVLAKLLWEGIAELIETIRLLINEVEFAGKKLFRELAHAGFQNFLEDFIKEHWIDLIFLTLGVFFIAWTLKTFPRDKQ